MNASRASSGLVATRPAVMPAPPGVYCYTRPLGRVPSPPVGSGLGYKRKLCWRMVVLMNTGMLSLTLWTGANGLRSALEASAKQTMSRGVWICIRVICVVFLSKSNRKMLVQTGIRRYRKGDMLYVPPAESVCDSCVSSHFPLTLVKYHQINYTPLCTLCVSSQSV